MQLCTVCEHQRSTRYRIHGVIYMNSKRFLRPKIVFMKKVPYMKWETWPCSNTCHSWRQSILSSFFPAKSFKWMGNELTQFYLEIWLWDFVKFFKTEPNGLKGNWPSKWMKFIQFFLESRFYCIRKIRNFQPILKYSNGNIRSFFCAMEKNTEIFTFVFDFFSLNLALHVVALILNALIMH